MAATELDTTRQVPEVDEGQRPVSPLQKLLNTPGALIFLALSVMVLVFGITAPGFFGSENIRNIATNASVLMVLSVGMTYVIATAGIDLSVGSVLVFSGVVSAKTMGALGTDSWTTVLLGFIVAVLGGAAWGLVNGFFVAKAKLPPLIVTLATMGAALGSARLITNGVDIIGVPRTLVNSVGVGRVAGVPVLVIIAGTVALVGGIWLHRSRFGYRTLAIGSNVDAAHRAGINVTRHLITVYVMAGVCSGIAGYLSLARFATTTLNGHLMDNLNAITAVVLGGTSLFGGVALMIGTVIGVFIPVVLASGFVIMGLPPFWQEVAIAVVLIAAVLFDQRQRGRRGST